MGELSAGVFDFQAIRARLDELGPRETISRPVPEWSPPADGIPLNGLCVSCGGTVLCEKCLADNLAAGFGPIVVDDGEDWLW